MNDSTQKLIDWILNKLNASESLFGDCNIIDELIVLCAPSETEIYPTPLIKLQNILIRGLNKEYSNGVHNCLLELQYRLYKKEAKK